MKSHTWRTVENSAPHLLPHLAPGQRVLDAGCGPGTITVDLAARLEPGEVDEDLVATEICAGAGLTLVRVQGGKVLSFGGNIADAPDLADPVMGAVLGLGAEYDHAALPTKIVFPA